MYRKYFFIIISTLFTLFLYAAENNEQDLTDPVVLRARSGDVSAQLQLGKEYFTGSKRPMNRALALYYFKLAAKAKSPEALFNLGMCNEYGIATPQDMLQAYEYYSQAGDFTPALFKKAVFLEKGIPAKKELRIYRRGIQADPETAKNIINSLILKKYPPAMTHQASKLLKSPVSKEPEFNEAFRLLSIAAEKNDVSAIRMLANCCEWGLGCEKDEKKALSLLMKAAEYGDGKAAAKLGAYYEHGIGTAPDMQKSLDFYKLSAELGEPVGMVQLAKHHSSGFIIKTDLKKAIELCEKAAALNERSAYTQLGIFATQGAGMPHDHKKAFLLFLKAAGMGDPEAQYYLALAFKKGLGTPIDESGAIFWLKRAASVHYAPAVELTQQWNIK